jgi:GDPmannose 4,6-dehydratase
MYLILQHTKPDDFVIATGVTTEVREFVRLAFQECGIDVEFKGKGSDEKGFVASCKNPLYQLPVGKEVVNVDKRYFRPTEVDLLVGNPAKANKELGWYPKYDLKSLVNDMVQSDIIRVKQDKYLQDGGYRVMNYFE